MEDALRDLDEIIAYARAERWRVGYFAALYRHVAVAFKHAAERGVFNEADLIQHLDVVFFDRFLDAVNAYREGRRPSESWQVAFDAAEQRQPTVMTHLLLGMNAHINFDLPIAVVAAVPADGLAAFKRDYDRMNILLSSVLSVVEAELARIWPWLGWLHRVLGRIEDGILNFSMREARALAWHHAETLAGLPESARPGKIAESDAAVSALGRAILNPGLVATLITLLMRLEQRGSVPHLIDILLDEPTARGARERSVAVVDGWLAGQQDGDPLAR